MRAYALGNRELARHRRGRQIVVFNQFRDKVEGTRHVYAVNHRVPPISGPQGPSAGNHNAPGTARP